MNLSLTTAVFLFPAVARRMFADSRGGKIINIVSLLSFQDGIRVPSDAASNSGLAGLTRV